MVCNSSVTTLYFPKPPHLWFWLLRSVIGYLSNTLYAPTCFHHNVHNICNIYSNICNIRNDIRNIHNNIRSVCHGTARDTRYARRVAFLSLFDIARQIVYPPWLPLYRFSRSRIPVELSSNPLESPRQLYVAINSTNLMLVHLVFACDTSSSWQL